SVIFKKGCNNAMFSSYSTILSIPVAGWGIIYVITIILLITFNNWLSKYYKLELIETAFWISVIGLGFSIYYTIRMIINPLLLCPLCLIFHFLNLIIFFLTKSLTHKSFSDLTAGLKTGIGFILFGKPTNTPFENWKWLPIMVVIIFNLAIFQWIRIEGMDQRIQKLESYSPLEELEKFDALPLESVANSEFDPIIGNNNAPVELVVFSDFQCKVCKMFAENFKQLLDYNQGTLSIRFKYFPISSDCNSKVVKDLHPLACKSALAAQAAHLQGMFTPFHDALYNIESKEKGDETFFDLADLLGLDVDAFKNDFYSEECQKKIAADIDEGIRLGVDGTPTVFLNGRQIMDLRPENINFLTRYLRKEIYP
ncbi:MAG: thioredoxin domain-containing protein, partial [Cyclobacteriaceae bacterium]|nr:thioredoxin domain-containing protein [Cyclobacteriaceae bacterium]